MLKQIKKVKHALIDNTVEFETILLVADFSPGCVFMLVFTKHCYVEPFKV